MRDYIFSPDDSGVEIPVSQMLTSDIHDCLTRGFILYCPDTTENRDGIIERLRIELVIRSLGL